MAVAGSSTGKQLFVIGSDGRGTAYGILELSRLAGVSPWVWWGDVTPEKQNRLAVADTFQTFQSPSVEYRGIFLNDEDWSLHPGVGKRSNLPTSKDVSEPVLTKRSSNYCCGCAPMRFGRVCMASPLLSTSCPVQRKWPTVAALLSVPLIANL